MTNYPYKMQLVVDPSNPRNVVAGGSVSIYDADDTALTTLLPLTDPNGVPITNPIVSNANGFTEPFVTTSPQVLWVSGEYRDYFESYEGMRNEAVAAKVAAENAAATAAVTALNEVAQRVASGEFKGENGTDGLNGSNVLPTSEAIEQAIVTDGPTKTALRDAFAPKWKPSTTYTAGEAVTAPDGVTVRAKAAFTSGSTYDATQWEYGTITGSANIPVIKSTTDTRPGVWEYTHNSTTGYLFHLLAGANFGSPAAILAIGNDNGTGTSILLPNKAGGKAIVIDQRSTVVSATAYGIHATQSSTAAPLVRLEQNVPDAAPALQVIAFGGPTATQTLAYFGDGTGEAGVIRALSGQIEWKRSIVIHEKDGTTPSYLNVTDNTGVPANTRTHTLIKKAGPEYYGYSGSAGQWWPFAVQVGGSRLKIQGGGLTGTVGTPGTLTNLIEFQNAKIGFFGAAPVARPAAIASPAADVTALKTAVDALRTALTTLGLTS